MAPFDSNGNASVTRTIAVTGQTIQAAQVNVPFADIQAMLSSTFLKTGAGQALADLNFGGFKAENLAPASAGTDAVISSQVLWKTIKDDEITAPTSAYVITDLSDFVSIRLSGRFIGAANTAFYCQVSSDNGVTWMSGASDYYHQIVVSSGTSTTTSTYNSNAFQISNASLVSVGQNGIFIKTEIEGLNKSRSSYFEAKSQFQISPSSAQVINLSDVLVTGVHNAIKIFTTANFTGHVLCEGVKG